MDRLLQKSTQLAVVSNALAIIYKYTEKAAHDDDGGSIMYQDQISEANLKLLQSNKKGSQMMPHAVVGVAKDGSRQYASINAALSAYPNGHK
ncbi:hypothetical protein FH972_009539 [Carpinus fangiana]|uniref:Uncharacterized protein n=1 Tax=Carpinus fangiana TaxID=176857 RepID=A0A660KKL6_9ROSI|nr:hypothetical protein FH972_009539 [Carpinus fangiana]